MISLCDECALQQNKGQFRRLFLQCCHGAGMTIATPFSSGSFSFIFILWRKPSPSAASTSDWGMQLCLQALLWLSWASLSPGEDSPSSISGFQCWHTGDWQAAQWPVLWLVATGRKERHYLKERLATQFLWTGRTVPSVRSEGSKQLKALRKRWYQRLIQMSWVGWGGLGNPKQQKEQKKWCSCAWFFIISRLGIRF